MLNNMLINIYLGVNRHQNTATDMRGGGEMVYVTQYVYTEA